MKGVFFLERRLSLLFGIIGGFFLTQLNGYLHISMSIGSMRGYVIDWVINILSIMGLIAIIYFCILLIIDTLKTIYKK